MIDATSHSVEATNRPITPPSIGTAQEPAPVPALSQNKPERLCLTCNIKRPSNCVPLEYFNDELKKYHPSDRHQGFTTYEEELLRHLTHCDRRPKSSISWKDVHRKWKNEVVYRKWQSMQEGNDIDISFRSIGQLQNKRKTQGRQDKRS